MFRPLIGLYVPREDFMPGEEMKETDGNYIWEVLVEEWGIIDRWDKAEEIVKAIMGDGLRIYDSWVEDEEEYFGQYLEASSELKSSWNRLREDLKHKSRFFNPELSELMEYLGILETTIKQGDRLFRARRCEDKKLDPAEMGAPPSNKAIAGRGNPEGISYLYLASDSITAISEIKPYVHQTVSIGKFSCKKELKIIDLRVDKLFSPFRYGDKLGYALKARSMFFVLGQELSRPIEPQSQKSSLDYLPTQYLCELIKNNGFDGISYKSTLGTGFNILLFSESGVGCDETELFLIDGINYSVKGIKGK